MPQLRTINDLALAFARPPGPTDDGIAAICRVFVAVLAARYRILALKSYRVRIDLPLSIPQIPCLDHEATIHVETNPHVSAYLRDAEDSIHEVAFYPTMGCLRIDPSSTLGEHNAHTQKLLLNSLCTLFPECEIRVNAISHLRADHRVTATARSHIRLGDVLDGETPQRLEGSLRRLGIIATLVEKSSRVSSWTVRTIYSPLIAIAGVALYVTLEYMAGVLAPTLRLALRYGVLALLAGGLLYFGLRAVHLTQIGTRLWKRCEEYRMILSARAAGMTGEPSDVGDDDLLVSFGDLDFICDQSLVILKSAWIAASEFDSASLRQRASAMVTKDIETFIDRWKAIRNDG